MPELPEVETVVRAYRPRLVGRTIAAFESRWPRQVTPSIGRARAEIVGRGIVGVSRRGKFIVIGLSGRDSPCLLVHLRMSGRFEWLAPGQAEPDHVRAVWTMDDGHRWAFCDARKFGRIVVAANTGAVLGELGVEPLERGFTADMLHILLRGRRRRLKPLLLDQTVIAGLGNIYTDEALFRAGLHPLAPSQSVDRQAAGRLCGAIRRTLREGIRRNGASLDWVYPGGSMQDFFCVCGRTGEPCRTCGAPIEYLRVGQRGTHVCPVCQPKPRRQRRR